MMNRLSLQDLRNLLIKKGRLLYGVVFLFCLVCFYGISTSQWQRVTELSDRTEVTEEPVSHNSETISAYGANKGTRGGLIENNKEKPSVGNSIHNDTSQTRAKNTETREQFITPIMGLTSALRSHPFDDPFIHPLRTENMELATGETNSLVKTDTVSKVQRFTDSHQERSGQETWGKRIGGSYRGLDEGSKAIAKGSHYNQKASQAVTLANIQVTGIVGGTTNLAMIHTDKGEACYGIGEGPGGLTIQAITSEAVLISDGNTSCWLYVE